MASSTSRSTTRRSSVLSGAREDAGSSNRSGAASRRSRSLSRFSGRFPPPPPPESDEFATPRGRFVNKARGAGFPEISLDDLADEFFRARVESEEESEPSAVARSSRGHSGARYSMGTESSRQRGRSVSRPPDRWVAAQGQGFSGSSSRRRRSVSVAREGIGGRYSESEIDMDHQSYDTRVEGRTFSNRKSQQPLSHKPSTNSYLVKRSTGQTDFFQSHDNYSSHSSLTDDETDLVSIKHGFGKTTQQKQPIGDTEGIELYETMRKEVRDAVEEIKVELEKVMVKTEPTGILGDNVQPKSSDVLKAITQIRRNYTAKLEESEKRKQDLLSKLAMEEECGQELSKIVKELLPSPKKSTARERSIRSTRRSNDRSRMSNRLTEEAERYFEDFLSNVEDTDISSFDGERSDSGSTMKDQGLLRKETPVSIPKVTSGALETDGVLFPWLHWETRGDSKSPCNTKTGHQLAASPAQEARTGFVRDQFASSFGNWSPGDNESSSSVTSGNYGNKVIVGNKTSISANEKRDRSFEMDEYLKLQLSEDLLFETAMQRQRIHSGGLILCARYLL